MPIEPFIIKQEIASLPDASSQSILADFKFGLTSTPFLADHGFHDMIVLPGSVYLEMAVRLHEKLFKQIPSFLEKVKFQHAVILTDEETVIRVAVRDQGGGRAEYAFYEMACDEAGAPGQQLSHCARMDIAPECTPMGQSSHTDFAVKEFIARSVASYAGVDFYRTLRKHGNQYGPQFQHIESIWQSDGEVLGQLSAARIEAQIGQRQHSLMTTLVDSFTQLLAALVVDRGRAFVLKSIDRIQIHDFNLPREAWVHGRLVPCPATDDKGFAGDAEVFDESGKKYLTLSSMAFDFLQENVTGKAAESITATLLIASTFTAEPLEDSIGFWSEYLNSPLCTRFAPYNQIFQELLGSESNFRKNAGGINAALLNLEDWVGSKPGLLSRISNDDADACFKNYPRCVLPNGIEVAHLNEYETSYVYKEIFEENCYLRHGIELFEGDTVVDIGANIGLFSLFIKDRVPNAQVYAFEPSPVVYDLLAANCRAYGPDIRHFKRGLSDRTKTAAYTFYEKSSVFSGFYPDEREDRDAIQTVTRNILRKEASGSGLPLEEYAGELTAERLRRRTYECRLTSLSNIIRENGISRIHLLKIDAERSELDILRGIEDSHWPLIDQLVVEVHDRSGKAVTKVEKILLERGYQCVVETEKLLACSGLHNIYATKRILPAGDGKNIDSSKARESALQRNTAEFYQALQHFMRQSTTPFILCLCPPSSEVAGDPVMAEALERAETELLSSCSALPNVHVITSKSILEPYTAHKYFDAHTRMLGHVPYTPAGYAAIGTRVFRTVVSLKRPPRKVIVLDCDNTLWKGVCGEDGPDGIEITLGHRFLQQFMVQQMQSGVLLCLCSKNNEDDVWAIFDKRADMVLKREHLASWRINWQRKSENIHALARELNLQMDSFVLVDDNPVECAEAKLKCPGVLALRLPDKSELIRPFLQGIWAFDQPSLTGEDRVRTRMYQQNTRREKYREQTFSLKEFIDGLQLQINVCKADKAHIDRVSQLTFRTNQFNFTTIRRSESEIRDFLNREDARCLVAKVSDRFGDYGLVGVVAYLVGPDRFRMDTFLLSCRVLGKGVEHFLLRDLAQRAQEEGKDYIELRWVPSGKNAPAYEFLMSLGIEPDRDAGGALTCVIPVDSPITFQPDEQAAKNAVLSEESAPSNSLDWPSNPADDIVVSGKMQHIGENLHDADKIAAAIEKWKLKETTAPAASPEEGINDLEAALLTIWRKVLANTQVGIHDNFFEAGGSSLKAVMVIAKIKQELKRNLSIITLFECPTVSLLAAKLGTGTAGPVDRSSGRTAEQRGQQRRYSKVKRRRPIA